MQTNAPFSCCMYIIPNRAQIEIKMALHYRSVGPPNGTFPMAITSLGVQEIASENAQVEGLSHAKLQGAAESRATRFVVDRTTYTFS